MRPPPSHASTVACDRAGRRSRSASPAAAAVVKPIVFPVDGHGDLHGHLRRCRDGCSRTHEGQDLMGKKMLPLLAAVDGVVHRVTFNNTSTGGNSVTIKGADGWTYHYLHVNNDTPGTDDGKATGAGLPANIVLGATVVAGQVVGYLGDSGNAESTGSHLHFEIRSRRPRALHRHADHPVRVAPSHRGPERSPWYLRRTAGRSGDVVRLRHGAATGGCCATGTATASTSRDLPVAPGTSAPARAGARAAVRVRHRARHPAVRRRRRRRADERCVPQRHVDRSAGFEVDRGRLDVELRHAPATTRSWATGTATATTTSASCAGTWYLRRGRHAGGDPVASSLRPSRRTTRSRATGTATATRRRASSAAAPGPPRRRRPQAPPRVHLAAAVGGDGRRAVGAGSRQPRSYGPAPAGQRRSRSLAMWVIWISSVPA